MNHNNSLNTNYKMNLVPQSMINGQYNNPYAHNLTAQLNMTNNLIGLEIC